jgi:RNA polymerase sigma factor (sigma-70 family)
VLHEAFLKTFEAERRVHVRAPTSFLFKTAKNLALNVISLRNRRRTETVADFEMSPVLYDLQFISSIDPEAQCLIDEQLARAEAVIASLTPRVREVFVLRKVYGLSHREIAAQLGISISTVEKHIVRGTLHMRRGHDGEADETVAARRNEPRLGKLRGKTRE